MEPALWISSAALLVAALNVGHTYLSRKPLVPAAVVEGLRSEVQGLTAKLEASDAKVAALEGRIGNLLMERDWWRDQYRDTKAAFDRVPPQWLKQLGRPNGNHSGARTASQQNTVAQRTAPGRNSERSGRGGGERTNGPQQPASIAPHGGSREVSGSGGSEPSGGSPQARDKASTS